MQNLEILEDSFLEKGLTIKKDFLQNLELSFQEEHFNQKIELLYYVGKCCMCVSFESQSLPGHGDVLKLVELAKEHFSWRKKLRELGWCANYMMDKRENNDLLIDFVFISYSPNHRIVDDQQPAVNFQLCNCYFFSTFLNS